MSLSEMYGRGKAGSEGLAGTMGGTLSGDSVDTSQFGSPAPSPATSFARSRGLGLTGGPSQGISGGEQLEPGVGAIARPGQPSGPLGGSIVGTPFGTDYHRELNEGVSSFASSAMDLASKPVKLIMDILGQLDRPQQFLFAAMTKGLESGNAFEGLKAGSSAFVFRRPEPGGPKRRVEPEELINTVGEEVFGVKNYTGSLSNTARFALTLGTVALVDPLLFVPGAWYSKAGTGIKDFHRALRVADQNRYAVTAGVDMVASATKARNNAISDFLFQTGKTKGPLGQTVMNVAEDLTDEELSVVRDLITGFGIRHVDDRLQPLLKRATQKGEAVSFEQVNRIMKSAIDELDEGSVLALTDEVGRVIANRRNSSDRFGLFTLEVGGPKKYVTFEEGLAHGTKLERELMIGQLTNRAGLDPTESIAASAKGLGLRKFIGQTVEQRAATLAEKGITVGENGSLGTTLLKAWEGLSNRQKEKILEKGVPGRNRQKFAREAFADEAQLAGLLSQSEIGRLQSRYLNQEARAVTDVRIGRREFAREALLTPGTIAKPKYASKAYEAALRRSVGTGRYVVDSVVEAQLASRYKSIGLVSEAGRNMAEIVSGVKGIEAMSELPSSAAKSDALRSMINAELRDTKDIHILHFMLDPKQVLPGSIYARGKYGEDLFNSVANAVGDEMNRIFQIGGKVIRESGEMDRKIGLASFADEMEALVKGGKKLNPATQELHDASIAARAQVLADDGASQVYRDLKATREGFRQAFIRRGEAKFASGGILNYMARVYPDFANSVKEGERLGLISADEAASLIRRSKRDINTALSPLELDFVDAKHVAFQHLKDRKFVEPLPGLETSAIKLMRAYTMGGLKKLYMEPAVKDMNELGKQLPRWRKKYLNLFLKRMLGYDIGDEAALNNLVEVMNGHLGQAVQKATFGVVKAEQFETIKPATKMSLWITRNFYRGLLGGNLGFMLKNFTQGINTAVQAGPFEVLRGAAMAASNPVVGKNGERFLDLVKSRNLLRDFNGLMEGSPTSNVLASNFHKLGMKFDDLLFLPARFSETFNRGIAMSAGMSQFMRTEKALVKGRTIRELAEDAPDVFADMVRFGHATANETQFIYGIVGRSPVAGTPTGRMALQFFSWPIKQVAFLRQGWKDERSMFMLRYIAFSGLISSIAEHSEVDATGFTGFGFMPSQASPSIQALGHLNAAAYAAFVEDNPEATEMHFGRLVKTMENLIPGALAWNKLASARESIETGEQRGSRGRFARRTDDPARDQRLSGLLDETVNPINKALGLPRMSGEQAVSLIGLPSSTRNRHRKALKDVERDTRNENIKHRKYVDDYIRAYASGSFVKAEDIRRNALAEGLYLNPADVKREIAEKQIPSVDRILDGSRRYTRERREAELMDRDPEIFRHVPGLSILPPDLLGGSRE